jgi:hypothetical protein
MRFLLSHSLLALACTLAATASFGESTRPAAAPAPVRPAVRLAQKVRAAVEGAASPAEAKAAVAALPKILGATFGEQKVRGETWWRITFAHTIPVRDFSQGMGWSRPFAVSPDVHQTSWEVVLWRADLFDFYHRPIIRSAVPRVGRWAVSASLTDRPKGELPRASMSASPAYDLLEYDGEVAGIEMMPWKPEYDQMWLVEQSRKEHEGEPILSAVAQPATYTGPCPMDVTFIGTLYDMNWDEVEIRWERSDGTWTDIEPVTIRAARQPVRNTWRVGAPHQRLEVWQKLHLGPLNLTSEAAKVTVDCE